MRHRPRRWQRRRWRSSVLTLGVVLLVVAGCGGDDDTPAEDPGVPPETPVEIRYGWLPAITGDEQVRLMATRPDLAANLGTWYELDLHGYPGTPQIVEGLAAGTLDAGGVGMLTLAGALAQEGADVVVTGQAAEERSGWGQSVWLVRTDTGITSPADVQGKTVGVNQTGSYVDYVADSYLQDSAGLEAGRDYDKVTIPFPQMQAALEAGRIDVGVFVPPFDGLALASGQFEVLYGATDVQDPLIVALQVFSREFVQQHPVTVEKFLEDYAALGEHVADATITEDGGQPARPASRELVVDATVDTTEFTAAQIDQWLLTRRDFYRPPGGVVDAELLQRNWDFFGEQGAFDAELDVEDYLVAGLTR